MSISKESQEAIKDILNMQEENRKLKEDNEKLKNKVNKLENKYVWGLQPIDYAFVRFANSSYLDNLSPEDYYSKEELSNEELHQKAIDLMKPDKFQIFGWTEVIEHMHFDDEIEKVLITIAKRDLG